MSDKTFLLLGAGESQVAAVHTAKKLGCRIIAIDGNPNTPGLQLADEGIHLDIRDVDKIIDLASQKNVDAVFSIACEVALPVIGKINDVLNLPGMTYEQALLVTDKGKMRERYLAAGIVCPAFFVFSEEEELGRAVDVVGLPAVIKPVDNSGSRGVAYVDSIEQLKYCYLNAKHYSRSGRIILEKFMPGTEVSVEAFVYQNTIHILTLSDKVRTNPPWLLDTEVNFPSSHSADLQEQIKQLAKQVIQALSLNNCPVHMEQLITPDGPRIVEVAARGPGFNVYTDIIPYVTGVNCVENELRILMGLEPDFKGHKRLYGASLQLLGGKEGIVKKVEGMERASALSGVHDLSIYVKPGDATHTLTCGSDRIGHIIAFGKKRQLACNLAKKAFNMISISYQ